MLNNKSCMLDSLMIAAPEIDLQTALVIIGHDGSERGFHSQEIIDVAIHYGYAVTEIQRWPKGVHPLTYETIKIEPPEGKNERFARLLENGTGVVMGSKFGRSHAVGYYEGLAEDPSNGINFRLRTDDNRVIEEFFVPHVYLKLDEIK